MMYTHRMNIWSASVPLFLYPGHVCYTGCFQRQVYLVYEKNTDVPLSIWLLSQDQTEWMEETQCPDDLTECNFISVPDGLFLHGGCHLPSKRCSPNIFFYSFVTHHWSIHSTLSSCESCKQGIQDSLQEAYSCIQTRRRQWMILKRPPYTWNQLLLKEWSPNANALNSDFLLLSTPFENFHCFSCFSQHVYVLGNTRNCSQLFEIVKENDSFLFKRLSLFPDDFFDFWEELPNRLLCAPDDTFYRLIRSETGFDFYRFIMDKPNNQHSTQALTSLRMKGRICGMVSVPI